MTLDRSLDTVGDLGVETGLHPQRHQLTRVGQHEIRVAVGALELSGREALDLGEPAVEERERGFPLDGDRGLVRRVASPRTLPQVRKCTSKAGRSPADSASGPA